MTTVIVLFGSLVLAALGCVVLVDWLSHRRRRRHTRLQEKQNLHFQAQLEVARASRRRRAA